MHFLYLDLLFLVELFPLLEEGVEGCDWHPFGQRQCHDEILHCWLLRLHYQLYGGWREMRIIYRRTNQVYIWQGGQGKERRIGNERDGMILVMNYAI